MAENKHNKLLSMMAAKGTGRIMFCICLMAVMLLAIGGCKKDHAAKSDKAGYAIDKVYERGPLTVHVRIDKSTINIAQTLNLELEARLAPNYKVEMLKMDDKMLANFGIVDWRNPDNRLDDKGNVVAKWQYRLEPFLSGKYALPEFTFNFHNANSTNVSQYQLTTEPIDIEITSLLGEQRAKLVIADIDNVVEMPRKISYWVYGTIGGLCAAAIMASTWFYLKRKAAEALIRIFMPAHEIAYERLRALVKDDLIKAGRIKEFYQRISDILRHYIEHRFNLKAPERTTEEFLTEIQTTDVLSAGDKEQLGEFLQHCDMVKFAKMDPTTEQIQRTFDLVKNFIEATKSDESKIDVTEAGREKQAAEVGSS